MQSEETRAEAKYLCQVKYNTISPKNANSIIGLVQGGLLAAYLITQRDTFITKPQFMNLLMCFRERDTPEIPPPTIYKPVELWTGKQIISTILPKINMYPDSFDMEKADETLVIIEGNLLSGTLKKKSIGPSTGSITHVIRNEYGVDASAQFLDTVHYTLNEWLKGQGFSVGISDCYMEDKDKSIETQINEKIEQIPISVEKYIAENKHLSPELLESGINEMLNKVLYSVGKLVSENIKKDNRLLQMVVGGSKGNDTNIAQIIGLLGGQNVAGKRIGFGFHRRTLPHFDYNDQGAKSRGFVFNSYKTGLSPHEYFFHAMGGREGLVDTAIKTGEVGYISRKLMKAMEDLGVKYDNTIRNSQSDIIQFLYGEDGIDPCDFEMQFIQHAKMDYEKFCNEYKYTPSEIEKFSYAYKESQALLDEEFDVLSRDREFIIKLHNAANGLYCCGSLGEVYLPVNIDRIIKNATQRFKGGRTCIHPVMVLREIDKLETRLEQIRGTRTMKSQPSSLKMLMIGVRAKLSAKQITHKHKFSSQAVQFIVDRIAELFVEHQVEPGEMTGSIAAQSVGEPTQQMTLNSVDWKEKVVIRQGQQTVFIGFIGKFVDDLITQNESKTLHLQDERDYLDIKHLNYHVYTVDENGKMSWKLLEAVTRHLPGGNLIKAKTRCGRTVKATKCDSYLVRENNKIVSKRGDELKVGDFLPIVEKCPLPESPLLELDLQTDTITERLQLDELTGFFYGAYLAEGNATNPSQISISNNDPVYLKRIEQFCQRLNLGYHTVVQNDQYFEGVTSTTLIIHSVMLRKLVVDDCDTSVKHIPSWAILANDNFLKGLLDGYFSGDGTVSDVDAKDRKRCEVRAGSASKELIQGIGLLLTRFGISVTFGVSQLTHNNLNTRDIKKSYTISIRNNYLKLFYDKIGFTIKSKQDKLAKMQSIKFRHNVSSYDTLPGVSYDGYVGDYQTDKLRKQISMMPENSRVKSQLESDLNSKDVRYSPVVEIIHKESSSPKVYDFTVADTRNFTVLNGLCVKDTFHSAGMSKANVTLGVPRVKEVIHAVQNLKTPQSHIFLDKSISDKPEKVLEMKTHLQGTKLKDILVADESSVYYEKDSLLPPFRTQFPEDRVWVRLFYTIMFNGAVDPNLFSYHIIRLVFDPYKMEKRGLTINAVANHLNHLLGQEMLVISTDINYHKPVIHLRLVYEKPPSDNDEQRLDEEKFMKQYLRQNLKEFVLCGAPGIKNVFVETYVRKDYNPVTKNIDEHKEWYLITEGSDLKSLLNWHGVDSTRSFSNNPMEILSVLGVEAARQSIILEIRKVMMHYGIAVNYRHLCLLADIMTARGGLMAINRHGINRTDESPLKKCTFEETVDMLLDAGKEAIYDDLNAVSSNIIVGKVAKLGTGMFQLKWNDSQFRKQLTPSRSVSKFKKIEHEHRKERKRTTYVSPSRENKFEDAQSSQPVIASFALPPQLHSSNLEPQHQLQPQPQPQSVNVKTEDVDTQSLFDNIADF